MKIITRFLSAVLALCLLTSLYLPARAAGTAGLRREAVGHYV